MGEWSVGERRLGMRDLQPGRLSEVELLKHLGDRHWAAIAARLGIEATAFESEEGQRLYATFATVELHFPTELPLHAFGEGHRMVDHVNVRQYANRFVEGLVVLGERPVEPAALAALRGRDDLAATRLPWAVLTSAFVERAGANSRLLVREPVGMGAWRGPVLEALPSALVHHRIVASGGDPPDPGGGVPFAEPTSFEYPVRPEVDLNGAGLFYFARYVGVFDEVVRRMLVETGAEPWSLARADALLTRSRRVWYFANAEPTDTLRCTVAAWELPRAGPRQAFGRQESVALRFELNLYRAGDGVWMARSIVDKILALPAAAA